MTKGIINLYLKGESIRLDNFEEIQKRDKFVAVFDPHGKQLVDIIGDYEFDEDIHCGLKDCNQPHKKGYIVLTSTDEETNIGNKCGKNIFGDSVFSSSKRNYKTNLEININRKIISGAKNNLDSWYEKLISSYNKSPHNARWAWEKLKSILEPTITGKFISSELDKMKKSLNGNVIIDRIATEDEAELLIMQGAKPPYLIETSLGEVKYLSVLSQFDELKKLVLVDIKETLELVSNIEPDSCDDYNLLKNIAKRANEVEHNFERINSIVNNAIKFLTNENLAPLHKKLTDHFSGINRNDNIKMFSLFMKSL